MPDVATLPERSIPGRVVSAAAAPAGAVDRVSRALRCHGARARAAACWAHPSWLAEPLGVDVDAASEVQQALATRAPRVVQTCSAALLRHWRVQPPDLSALAGSSDRAAVAVALLGLAPASAGLRMLRMRALLGHLGRLRRTIDRAARDRFSAALGVPLSDFVTHVAAPARPVVSMAQGPTDDESLAAIGYRALMPVPGGLCALMLPRGLACAQGEGADPALDASWAAMLPDFFPEWTWLFG